jgi:hypothetical protein
VPALVGDPRLRSGVQADFDQAARNISSVSPRRSTVSAVRSALRDGDSRARIHRQRRRHIAERPTLTALRQDLELRRLIVLRGRLLTPAAVYDGAITCILVAPSGGPYNGIQSEVE